MDHSAEHPLVTVVLVNLNCGRLVDLIFPSLLKQTYPALELLVVDNGSTDGSCEVIAQRYPQARIVRQAGNTGFSGALNAGIRLAKGEFVLSLNFDVVLEAGFVDALVGALARRPDAGWAAGLMLKLRDGAVLDSIDCNGHFWLPSRYVYGYDPAHPEVGHYDTERDVFGASACAALYRRSMLDAVAVDGEIFDEDLFAYFEDVDLDWRAQQLGYRCVFTPAARGAHVRGGTGLSSDPAVGALIITNRLLVMAKNDEIGDVLRDWSPILRRTIRDVVVQAKHQPRSLWPAAARIVRLLPRMLAKRRVVKKRRVATREYVRGLQMKTEFLG